MKWKLLGLMVLLVFTFAATALAAQSEEKQNSADQKGTMSEAATDVSNNALAARLAVYAREAKSPMALATAAQIYASCTLDDAQKTKTDEKGAVVPSVSDEKAPAASALFAEAVAMAKEQQNVALAELIDKQAKASGQTKGRSSGATRHVDMVKAGTRDVYEITFRGDEVAMVAAESRNGADIDLHIYDENGNLIEKDTDTDGVPVCLWTPRWTGKFTVKVSNPTSNDLRYTLMTN
jgi:hypothetical protein